MASVTLVESAKLALDDLVAGIIENIITVNHMFEMLPFDGIDPRRERDGQGAVGPGGSLP